MLIELQLFVSFHFSGMNLCSKLIMAGSWLVTALSVNGHVPQFWPMKHEDHLGEVSLLIECDSRKGYYFLPLNMMLVTAVSTSYPA